MNRIFNRSNASTYRVSSRDDDMSIMLKIATDYVPVYQVNQCKTESNVNGKNRISDLLFLRLAKQGLVIAHKPSLYLGRCGTLPSPKRGIKRNDSLRPNCRRSKSDRCREIKWQTLDSIEHLQPRILILKLRTMPNEDSKDKLLFCSHNYNKNLIIPNTVNDNTEICFEFLLSQELDAFITSCLHYGIISPNMNKGSKTIFDRIANWIHKRKPQNVIRFK